MPKNPQLMFDPGNCNLCGECLAACPYMNLSRARAAREISRLIAGRPSAAADGCAGCMTCDTACPRGNRPYTLIRSSWNRRYSKRELPLKARFLMPTMFPNFRSSIRMSAAEKKLLRGFSSPPAADTVLYTGCNSLLFPSSLMSPVLGGIAPFGSFEYCCGEMYYRMGLFDAARGAAQRLRGVFRNTGIRKMVFTCAACMNMISNVYPNEFGIEFDFEKEFYAERIAAHVESGKLKIRKPMRRKVTVQDSCHAKMMPPSVADSARRLLEMTGAEIVEMRHTRNESLCCGIAAACSNFRLADLARTSLTRLEESRKTGASVTAAYCNGCLLTLSAARFFHPASPRVSSLLDIVRAAAGEKPDFSLPSLRAAQTISGIAAASAPLLLTGGKFRVPE